MSCGRQPCMFVAMACILEWLAGWQAAGDWWQQCGIRNIPLNRVLYIVCVSYKVFWLAKEEQAVCKWENFIFFVSFSSNSRFGTEEASVKIMLVGFFPTIPVLLHSLNCVVYNHQNVIKLNLFALLLYLMLYNHSSLFQRLHRKWWNLT